MSSQESCPYHPESYLIEDHHTADLICSECGLVVVSELAESSTVVERGIVVVSELAESSTVAEWTTLDGDLGGLEVELGGMAFDEGGVMGRQVDIEVNMAGMGFAEGDGLEVELELDLDEIIMELIDEIDRAGPPMDSHNIQVIPTVNISEAQVSANSSCSVCWEDFTMNEDVKLVECGHLFHEPCIVPWLEMHSTCPNCRKLLDPAAAAARDATQAAAARDATPAAAARDDTPPHPDQGHHEPFTNASGPLTLRRMRTRREVQAAASLERQPLWSDGSDGLTGLRQSSFEQMYNYKSPGERSRSNDRSGEPPGGGFGSTESRSGGFRSAPSNDSVPAASGLTTENPATGVSICQIGNISPTNSINGGHSNTGHNDEDIPASLEQLLVDLGLDLSEDEN